VDKICRSTLSDAMAVFDSELLVPLIEDLQRRVPNLAQRNPELAAITKQVIAGDGSLFNTYSDVAWALMHRKSDGKKQAQICLNLQLDVSNWSPQGMSISGDDGSEPSAFRALIKPGVIYVNDRNFLDFKFMNAVLDGGSDLVLRVRSETPKFTVCKELPLCDKDRAHGVISDRIGTLPGSAGTPAPPGQMLREVIIISPETQKPIRLLANLLDVPAYIIGLLYRERWQIELFFRWLKGLANFEHLISHSLNGLTLQFYIAVIGVLQICVRTGKRPSKYAFSLLGMVAAGQATLEEILPILAQREREADMERARLARKRAEKKSV